MRTLMRLLATLVAGIGTYCFLVLFGGALLALLLSGPLPGWLTFATSALVAILVARYIWIHTGSARVGLFRFIAFGSLMTGAIAFLVGFFGPIVFTPHANQGPLLGIFITGPLGFILGGIGGALYWFLRRDRTAALADGPPNNRWRGP
jgi:hypothetical protein